MAEAGRFIGAICAAPRVLAEKGILDGKKATAYPGFINPDLYPEIEYTGSPVERDGAVLTSRGPGTAMDFGLAIIEMLTDTQTRDRVEQGLVRP